MLSGRNVVRNRKGIVMENLWKTMALDQGRVMEQLTAGQELATSLYRYQTDFSVPLGLALAYLLREEWSQMTCSSAGEQVSDCFDLMTLCLNLWGRSFSGTVQAWDQYWDKEAENLSLALTDTWLTGNPERLKEFLSRQAHIVHQVAHGLPEAIQAIEQAFGFHFKASDVAGETERFFLYRVEPTHPQIAVQQTAKPILIIPPFVLGSNILAFLPKENKSYAHAFANQGIPTYIRVMKDIQKTPACQTMTMEEDILDIRHFCEQIMTIHGKKVTLNGYCQGGFTSVCAILSNELDLSVDALITCVAPMDGTRSQGLSGFLNSLPPRFNRLCYGTKVLPSGNSVADGQLMGWVYKLKSIETEAPLPALLKDAILVKNGNISKTAAALNFWLKNERSDIPLNIARMSFNSFTIPVTKEGVLPVRPFGRTLNFKGIREKNMPWLLCYGENDDLVEKEAALAPLDFLKVETSPFPKGHVAIATSWSNPSSDYALDKKFGNASQYRGPVRFQLDLNQDSGAPT